MPTQKRSTGKSNKTGFMDGQTGFPKTSAIEGIHLKPAMKDRAAEAISKGLSAEEYRTAIIRAHRKA
jgi:hypothetical protein